MEMSSSSGGVPQIRVECAQREKQTEARVLYYAVMRVRDGHTRCIFGRPDGTKEAATNPQNGENTGEWPATLSRAAPTSHFVVFSLVLRSVPFCVVA